MKKQIIIAQRGWVFIGTVIADLDSTVVIEQCKNIRRWGTTKGLGELAKDGPQPSTITDDMGRVELHPLSIVARIDVTSDKW